MFKPARLRKNLIPDTARQLDYLADKRDAAMTKERFDLLNELMEDVLDASRCYVRTRIKRSGDELWADSFHGVIFPMGLQIRMTAAEGMVYEESAFKDIAVMGIAYKYNTGTPEIRLRCLHGGEEADCPLRILTGKGVARLLRVLAVIPLPRKSGTP